MTRVNAFFLLVQNCKCPVLKMKHHLQLSTRYRLYHNNKTAHYPNACTTANQYLRRLFSHRND